MPILKLVLAGTWRGTASQLLGVLDQKAVAGDRRRRDWPRGLSQFSGVLRRIAPSLRAFGILIEFTRDGHQGRRQIELRLEALSEAIAKSDRSDDADTGQRSC